MSTNIAPYVGGSPQIVRGTSVGGEDVQHVLVADASGNLVESVAVGSTRSVAAQRPDSTATGTIASISDTVQVDVAGASSVVAILTGTWSGNISFQVSADGTNWDGINPYGAGGNIATGFAANNVVRFPVGGFRYARARTTSWVSGTATVAFRASLATQFVSLHQSLPTGTNTIGNIGNVAASAAGVRLSDGAGYLTTTGGKLAVDNSGQTQPVSDAGGSLTVDSPQLPSALASDRLKVDGSGVTQPISVAGTLPVDDAGGSLTIDAPLASPVHARITDGTNSPSITNAEPSNSAYGVVTRAIQQSTPTFWAVYDRVAPATNKYMAVLWNSSATRVVRVRRIWRMDWQVAAVVGVLLEQELRYITARTGVGTAVTPTPLDSIDTLSAGIDASHAATGVTDGPLLSRLFATSEEVILAAAGQVLGFSSDERYQIVYEESRGSTKPITLRQNRGVAIKNITASTIGTVSYIFEFTDEAV